VTCQSIFLFKNLFYFIFF